MAKTPKRPRDANQLAKRIVDLATGQATEEKPEPFTPAQEFARSGGLKGGYARAASLTAKDRSEIAKAAAAARWKKKKSD